jgi:hypothetical protein
LNVSIRYSVERGFEDEALRFARRLFAVLDEAIASLELIPDEDAAEDLAVYLDGRPVHSQRRSGRAPRVANLLAASGCLTVPPAAPDDSR